MAPLSVITRVAAGPKQNKAEMKLVVWLQSWRWAAYISQILLLTASASLSL